MTITPQKNHRNTNIDFLRGFAIISVILLHCYIHLPATNLLQNETILNLVFRSGYYGVMIFFVISGYLITSTSLQRWGSLQDIKIIDFYRIRFARIMPCLFALILILSVLDYVNVSAFVIKNTSLSTVVVSALTFQINYLEAKVGYLPGSWDVLWSLSVEEMFYLFFPLMAVFIRNRTLFTAILLLLIVLGPFARSVFMTNDIWSDHSYLSCMDGIAIGCLAALYGKKINLLGIIGVGLFFFVFFFRHAVYLLELTKFGFQVTILEISVALMLMNMNEGVNYFKLTNSKIGKIAQVFGKNSYEIYLIHSIVIVGIVAIFEGLTLFNLWIISCYIGILSCSLCLGMLISKYYSQRMSHLLRNVKLRTVKGSRLKNVTD